MTAADRDAVSDIISCTRNFNPAEVRCALELVDISLNDPAQRDYRLLVAEDSEGCVRAYACWCPAPMARGTYDVYWVAAHPASQGRGFGRRLFLRIEEAARRTGARLTLIETSSKESYAATAEFYRRIGYMEESRIRDFYDAGDDRLVFVKRLARQGA